MARLQLAPLSLVLFMSSQSCLYSILDASSQLTCFQRTYPTKTCCDNKTEEVCHLYHDKECVLPTIPVGGYTGSNIPQDANESLISSGVSTGSNGQQRLKITSLKYTPVTRNSTGEQTLELWGTLTWSVVNTGSIEAFRIEHLSIQGELLGCLVLEVFNISAPQNFSYGCIPGPSNGSQTYQLNVTSLPEGATETCAVYVPPYTEDPTQWKSLVGVCIREIRVLVLLQLPPVHFNFTLLEVTLEGPGGTKQLNSSQEAVIFSNVSQGNYTVSVVPLQSECSSCTPAVSPPFLVTEDLTASTVMETTSLESSGQSTIGLQNTSTTHGDTEKFSTRGTLTQTESTTSSILPTTASKVISTAKATSPSTTLSTGHSSTQDNGVIVKPKEDDEYAQSITIILATVFSFIGLVIIIMVVCCIVKQRRRRSSSNIPMHRLHARNSDEISFGGKLQPLVLLVYSSDCDMHDKVITEFANYLREVCSCDVQFDQWQYNFIQDRGPVNWLLDQIDTVSFVILVCSTGARFQCTKGRKLKATQNQAIPDMFVQAVDYISEKMRVMKNNGEAVTKFISVHFEYSVDSDIPPKLDRTYKFFLMKDIFDMYKHIHGLKVDVGKSGSLFHGVMAEYYANTEAGRELQKAINDCKDYYKDNPQWLHSRLDHLDVSSSSGSPGLKSNKGRPLPPINKQSVQSSSQTLPVEVHVEDEEDTLRRKLRMRYLENGTNPRSGSYIKMSSNHIPSNHSSASSGSPLLRNIEHESDNISSEPEFMPVVMKSSSLPPLSRTYTPQSSDPLLKSPETQGQKNSYEDSDEEESVVEEDMTQMLKDIEFIRNYTPNMWPRLTFHTPTDDCIEESCDKCLLIMNQGEDDMTRSCPSLTPFERGPAHGTEHKSSLLEDVCLPIRC